MCHTPDPPSEKDLERQKQLEADAVQNGIARLVQSLKYRRATDSKPIQDLMAIAWESLVEAILKEQLALKSSERQKLHIFQRFFVPTK